MDSKSWKHRIDEVTIGNPKPEKNLQFRWFDLFKNPPTKNPGAIPKKSARHLSVVGSPLRACKAWFRPIHGDGTPKACQRVLTIPINQAAEFMWQTQSWPVTCLEFSLSFRKLNDINEIQGVWIINQWLYHGFTMFYDTLRAKSFRGPGSPGLTHRFRTADLSHNRWRVVNLPFSSAASSLVGSHMPSQKQKSKSVKSPQVTHLPSTHHPPIHQTPSNHPTKHTAATPLFWDHTGLRLQSRHQTQPGCSPWCHALNFIKPYGFQGVHPWRSSWLPASSASLLWRLAWSGATATEPCRFPFGGSNSTAEGIPAIRHVMFTQFCEATVENMLYQHSTNQHSASWTEFYKSPQFCVNFTHLFTNHLLLGNGSKPCSPVVHIKIAGIYGCSSPYFYCIYRYWSIAT